MYRMEPAVSVSTEYGIPDNAKLRVRFSQSSGWV
jgi:hypothetical protein